jgi:hypothetical protein
MGEGQFPIPLEILEGSGGVAQIREDFFAYLSSHAVLNQEQGGAG